MNKTKFAVFFPGIGYTVDKPLMHFGRRIASDCGYEIKLLPYEGFPAKVKGDREKMVESFKIALKQSEKMLADVYLSAYEDILFVGKSVGTIVAAKIAAESTVSDKIRLVLYTPLDDTFRFLEEDAKAIVFTGAADPWVGGAESKIPELCEKKKIPYYLIPEANHSLESADTKQDLENLKDIMEKTKKFVLAE